MTRYYLVANRIGGGGTFSPRIFDPRGLFEDVEVAHRFILSKDDFSDLGIIILESDKFDKQSKLTDSERKFSIQDLFDQIQFPESTNNNYYFVTSTSHVQMPDGMQSFYPNFRLNMHGVFGDEAKAKKCLKDLHITDLKNGNYSSLPIITQTKLNPNIGWPVAIIAQHIDMNLLNGSYTKPYMLTVKKQFLDKIQTSVLESIYPYFAYTNVDPAIVNLDEHVQNLINSKRIQSLHNAAALIFSAKNWNKIELKKYLFMKFDEGEQLINFHLIDYPEQKTCFDQRRMYMSIQLVCNYINEQEKTQSRLDKQSQEMILQMLVDVSPIR